MTGGMSCRLSTPPLGRHALLLTRDDTEQEVEQMIFVGLDWAESEHAVCVLDEHGGVLATRQIPESTAGMSQLQGLLAGLAAEPEEVVIGIETDRGLLVRFLEAAGYQLYAINPLAASRYRDRHKTSGSKSDPGDAKMLADLVRTDRHNHRPLVGDSSGVEALQILTRSHQRAIWTRQRQVNQLRNTLRECYPAALAAFGDLAAPEALAILQRAPTALRARSLSQKQLVGLLRRAGRERKLEQTAAELQEALRAPQVELPREVADAYGRTVTGMVGVIAALSAQIQTLEAALGDQFQGHPDAEILTSLPGLGVVLGARVLAEFGDDPTRYSDSKARKCYAGTAPITRTSGLRSSVHRRTACNSWLVDACTRWAFCSLRASPGARGYYLKQRARGKSHQQALRALANRLVGILHGCHRSRSHYDERVAWPELDALARGNEPADNQNKSLKMTGSRPGSSTSITASA